MLFQKFFFRLLFRDTNYLIEKARTQVLHESDMPALPDGLMPESSPTVKALPLHLPNWKFIFSLIRVYWFRLKFGYLFYAFAMCFSLLSPVLIHRFVSELEKSSSFQTSVGIGIALALCGVFSGISLQHYFFATLRAGQMITNDVNQLLFRQSLELSLQARTGSQVGDIVNHMSSDSDALADFPIVLGDLCWALMTILAASGMLFFYIGWSALAALVVLIGLVPLTQFVAKRFVQYEEKMMNEKDARITLMTQLLNAIRVIKFFAWEKAVSSEVGVLRAAELKSRQKLARAEVLSGVSYVAVSSLVLFVALFVHSYRGFELDAATIFTCIALFGLLEEPFGHLSRLFSRFSQALVSSKRILDFLNTERVKIQTASSISNDQLAIELTNASFAHGLIPVVKNLNLQVTKGSSLAIVGPVGSGKTSLLQGLLSECHLLSGNMAFHPDVKRKAFVPQEAFIVNASLLDNVLFGEDNISKEHLRKAIHQACLEKDIRDLPSGLRTEIGEKGVNLSGGQKQRVSLARAVFAKPDLVFLDDPLSAVDVETEKQLCDRLIFGEWEKSKVTRIVATHRLESLSRFDQVLFLKNGEVQALGTFADLLKNNSQFQNFYREHEKSHEGPTPSIAAAAEVVAGDEIKDDARITEDEEREKGAVKASVYWNYILSLRGPSENNWILVALGILAVLAAAMPLIQKGWLANYEKLGFSLTPLHAVEIYGGLGVLVLILVLCNQLFWLERGIVAGRNFHDRMLRSILRAPVRFFDSTPVGRILQRFSRDLESVDIYLQWSFESFIHCLLHVTVSLILVLSVLPVMIFIIGPTLWIYNRIQQDYRRPAREAKRFDSVARSPRYAHFKETLMGLVVIRAFDKREWFLKDFFHKLSHSQRMFYGHYMLNRWFSTRVPLVAGVISVSTLIGISYAVQQTWISAGLAGLVTIYALTFWSQLNWGIRIFADIESRMTSVERLKFYSNIESEKISGSETPRSTWPEKGELVVQDLQAQYAPHLPMVLKGLNFHVQAGQRIGIVGRTGSGKTTLFQVLYRFLEASHGSILVDGVDIGKIDLERLRRSLAIVPQDPSLFMGSLRSNLDRYQEYTDDQVWKALDQAGLGHFVRGLTLQLQTPVAENGSNLSQGQRQLLCLARALLIRAKIVLMDEATASVDVQTDNDVQRVIREQLKGVTMLIIAHRLGTVADCDQVIEMADGQVKQIHTPSRESKSNLEALLDPK